MVNLEQNILDVLLKKGKKMTLQEIADEMQISVDEVSVIINNLEKEGRIFRNKKNQFLLWNNGLNRAFGIININKRGAGIIKTESDVIFVHKDFLNGSLSGDKVVINDLKNLKDKNEGKVERVIERNKTSILCEVVNYGGIRELVSVSDNKNLKVKVDSEDLKKYVDGDRLLVEVGVEKENDKYLGNIIKKICHKDDPKSDIIAIAINHGFEFDFPEEVKEEVKKLPSAISDFDMNNRKDLRDKMIFTIDGDDTKDIDDAISLEILPNGNYKLGVHIADVSHYVKSGSALFNEALKRGTSVYMLDTVIPMFPRELSNGICSLNPHEDRLTKTCEIELDEKCNIVSFDIFDSVINSKKKMTYSAVNKLLEDGIVEDGYEEYIDILLAMHNLSEIMENKRLLKGAVEFENPEMKIMTDDKGRFLDIKILSIKKAEMLIENFMLIANEVVATSIAQKNLPCIYRIHDIPNIPKLQKAITTICNVSEEIERPIDDICESMTIQKFLDELKPLKEYPIFSNMILRSMSKAIYSSDNIGHFGLAKPYYAHFTSPIRRFPDLLLHTLINLYRDNDLKRSELRKLTDKIEEMAKSSSDSEREACQAEYDANYLKIAEYMENHIDEEYEGIISDISEKGIKIRLDNLIEGTVNFKDLEPNRFYYFDEKKCCLIADDVEYHLGDRILSRVKDVNRDYNKVSFTVLGHVKEEQKDAEKIKKLNMDKINNIVYS